MHGNYEVGWDIRRRSKGILSIALHAKGTIRVPPLEKDIIRNGIILMEIQRTCM